MIITKAQALLRVGRLVEQLKHINCANCPDDFSIEMRQCELEIELLEKELSLIIDNFMVSRFDTYSKINRRKILTEEREQMIRNWKIA